MAITNQDRVGKAMELLRAGLAPFVERELKSQHHEKTAEEARRYFGDDRTAAKKPITEWDVAALLKLMWEAWNEVFGRTLGRAERSRMQELRDRRDEPPAEQEGDFDADSRWALTWFEQSGFDEGEYGVAEQLSKSKNTSVAGMVEAGILASKRGKVRLLAPADLPADWDPATDPRLTAWEIVHHLIRVLASGGEGAAGELVAKLGAKAEIARELAYRLYTLCERKKRAAEALAHNGLVQSWPEIARLARESASAQPSQGGLFETEA